MSEDEEVHPRRKPRRNPLDIDYSLKIGTSVYHVLGKRHGRRRGEFDYYVMDDVLIRSQPRGSSQRPRYIVDEPRRKKNRHSPSPKASQLDIGEIKQALVETMENERKRILDEFCAELKGQFKKATEADNERHQSSNNLIQDSLSKARDAQNESTTTAINDLKAKLVTSVKKELDEFRSDLKTAQENEQTRLGQLFSEQRQALSAAGKPSHDSTSAPIARIESAVTKALQSQRDQNTAIEQDIKTLNDKLEDMMEQMKNQYSNIKIANDLDDDVNNTLLKPPSTN